MSVTSPDFESGAYTNFATPALREEIIMPVSLRRNQDAQPGAVGESRTLPAVHAARQAIDLRTKIMASPLYI
jgi:hypothetical protein